MRRELRTEAGDQKRSAFIDSVQVLALGGYTLNEVVAIARRRAHKKTIGIDGIFDVFTDEQLNYGDHVESVMTRLSSDSVISGPMLYPDSKKYKTNRSQLQIVTGLQQDTVGEYFGFQRRSQSATSSIPGPWTGKGTAKFGGWIGDKLYIRDMDKQQFFTMKNGLQVKLTLGDPSSYDQHVDFVYEYGRVAAYEEILNTIDQDVFEDIVRSGKRSAQQFLFLSTYKGLLSSLEAQVQSEDEVLLEA